VLDALAVTYCDAYRPRVVYREPRAPAKAVEKTAEERGDFDDFMSALVIALRPFQGAREAVVRLLREKLGREAPPG
jgi:hypothetical protein